MRSACHHHHVESAENLDSLCLISLCSELLSLFLLGRASESRGRQTGSLTRAAMLSPLQHRPVFVCSPLLWLDRFPVACGISETRNNERCKSGQKKCEIHRRSQRMWRFAKSRASLASLLMESYGDVKETYQRHSGDPHVDFCALLSLQTNCTSQEVFYQMFEANQV